MASRTSPRPPQVRELRLPGLADGDPADLVGSADLESVRYADLTLSRLDLPGARLSGVRLQGVSAAEADLTGARLAEVHLDLVDLPVVRAGRSQWREVQVTGRLGSVEAHEAQLRSVHFIGCKLGFVNLRGAELLDVAFTDCVVEDLDLVQCRARRVGFAGTRVTNLRVQDSELHDLDLRGARLDGVAGLMHLRGSTLSPAQLADLAPAMAAELGIGVGD
ncbi:pentapeptide repeat-containing protein [Nocardioides pantholopis]|uniref:pentapeptide repeat-containing protein n=1 Tax=Nocardioides pantholopis TaxID=2483798 RepID=UPI000F0737D7|nr:pentapeptide repeat-containing protein [Nocardioides pantholopis]